MKSFFSGWLKGFGLTSMFWMPSIAMAQQNLVLNPSFEDHIPCSQFNFNPVGSHIGAFDPLPAPFWSNPVFGTTDFISFDCFPDLLSYLVPAKSGTNYASMFAIYEDVEPLIGREMVQGTLAAPLVAGKIYCLGYWTRIPGNLSGFSTTNQFGMGLSDTLVYPCVCNLSTMYPSGSILPPYALKQDDTMAVLYDSNWYHIQGLYKAHGGERFLIIGNLNTVRDTAVRFPGYQNQAYFAVDDVSVVETDYVFAGTSNTQFCPGGHANLYALAGMNKYIWSTGETTSSISTSTPGLYFVAMESDCGVLRDTFYVSEIPSPPQFSLGADTSICASQSVLLTAPSGFLNLWSTGTTAPEISINQTGNYSLTLTDGCDRSSVDTIFVNVTEPPPARKLLFSDNVFCNGSRFLPGSLSVTSPYTLLWSTGDSTASIHIAAPGIYSVSESNECGSNMDSLMVPGCTGVVAFPTAFSPNGDTKNDYFRPVVQDIQFLQNFSLLIFDRLGNKLFSGNDAQSGWDGTVDAKPAPVATYFYYSSWNDESQGGKKIEAKGDFTLMR